MAEIASPKATGARGPAFEFKVQASFLATMLVGGRYPCLPEGQADFIRLQARQLGYQTDDLLVQMHTPVGHMHRLLAQVKSDIAFTEGNKDFRETLIAAWTDFSNAELFNRDKDVLIIISGPGSKQEIRHFRSLLNWSRSSLSAEDYFTKVSTPNFGSEEMRTYLAAIQVLLGDHLETEPSRDEIWQFMKCVHWISYDFDEASSRDIAMILTMLQLGMKAHAGIRPEEVWSRLLQTSMDYDPVAGSITPDSLARVIGCSIIDLRVTKTTGLERLAEHAEAILAIVRTCFRDGTHLDREWLVRTLWDILSEQRVLLVTGLTGVGKSATIKEMVQSFAANIPTFILKADELDRPHLDNVLTEIGVEESIRELSSRFGLLKNKIFVVESLEKLLEADCLDAFQQLLHFVLDDPTWMVVLSCRSYALGTVRDEILMPQSIAPPTVEIPPLADFELQRIASEPDHIGLERLLRNESLKEVLRVPMYLSYVCSPDLNEAADTIEHLDVYGLEQLLWASVIRNDKQRRGGIHLQRERCFTQIAVNRGRNMTPFVPVGPFDAAVLQTLEADDLVIRTEEGVAPAHDLFEEWAINRYVDSLYREYRDDLALFFDTMGAEPAMRRGFRTWLVRQFARETGEEIGDFITRVSQNTSLSGFWRDEVIVAVLLSSQAHRYFAAQKDVLLGNNLKHLIRIIHLLRTACKEPDTEKLEWIPVAGRDFLNTMFLKPSGSGWSAAIEFLLNHLDFIDLTHARLIAGLLQDWANGLGAAKDLTQESRSVGLIALHLLNLTRKIYDDDLRSDLLRVAFRVSSFITEELRTLFDETLKVSPEEDEYGSYPFVSAEKIKPDQYRFYESIRSAAVESFYSSHLCDSMPDAVSALAKKEWIRPPATPSRYQHHLDLEPEFGMGQELHQKMIPPSALQGPFLSLLTSHPQNGIELILELINSTSEQYAHSDLDSPSGEIIPQVIIRLNDGMETTQYVSWRLWGTYRGRNDNPKLTICDNRILTTSESCVAMDDKG